MSNAAKQRLVLEQMGEGDLNEKVYLSRRSVEQVERVRRSCLKCEKSGFHR